MIDYTSGNGGGDHHSGAPTNGMGSDGDGVDNPQHQASQEYINGNENAVKKKEGKINTDV